MMNCSFCDNGRGLSEVLAQRLPWEPRKTVETIRIATVQAGVWTRDFSNTKQEYCKQRNGAIPALGTRNEEQLRK